MLSLGFAIALVAVFTFAASDTIAKKVSEKIGSKRASTIMLTASIIPLLAGLYFFGASNVNLTTVLFSAASGLTYALAYLLMYKSLETAQVANTISLGGIEWALISIFSIFALGESVTSLQVLCFIGIFAGAFLVTTEKKFAFNRAYIPAIGGMIAFAITYILLIYALQGTSGVLLPTLINRITAVVMLLLYLKASPETISKFKNIKITKNRTVLVGGTLMGIFNGVGAVAVLGLAVVSFVAVGSVIVAVEPAIVILLGYILYKERFVRHQIFGFVLLLASIIILSAL
jgi:drug/metabolite transporter (DMT)-like permease